MITYEVTLGCDACDEEIFTEQAESVPEVEELRAFAEAAGWKATALNFFCPKHARGCDACDEE